MPSRVTPRQLASPIVASGLAIALMWLIRQRSHMGWYLDFHYWMDEHGVSPWARNLDSEIIMLLSAAIIWAILRLIGPNRKGSILADLGLGGDWARIGKGLGVGALIGAPMLVFAIAYALIRGDAIPLSWDMIPGVVVAPVNEEVFFRGLLVFAAWRISGLHFWPLAIVAALLFGSAHTVWTLDGLSTAWGSVLLTAAGGVWYAWLAQRWSGRLGKPGMGMIWLPMVLHGTMNLSWALMSAGDGAVGGLWPNVGRVLTIAFGVALTLKRTTASASPYRSDRAG